MRLDVFVRAVMLAVVILVPGCAGSLPIYKSMGGEESLEAIARRQEALCSLSAECELELTDAAGREVKLDAVLVAQPPRRVRLRAWKLGRAVFDLTIADGRAWLFTPEDGLPAGAFQAQDVPARQLGDALSLLGPEYFRSARLIDGDEMILTVRGTLLGHPEVECRIDRRTLVPLLFAFGTESGEESRELSLTDYRAFDRLVWPMRLQLRGPSGTVVLRFREVELNGELAPGAFIPSARASEIP